MAMALPLAGCGGTGGGGGSNEHAAAAIEAARAYQQASVDQDWETACEARTERLRQSLGADTIAECVEITGAPRLGNYSDAQVSIGETVEVSAFGPHPAGIGLRVTLETGTGGLGMTTHTALRLVPGEQGKWLVDQAVNLVGTEGTDAEAVWAALDRK
ncbi:hypothetical protein ACIRP2_37305 [Streptomyces sp. NPDC101194]|uniref:hypothetical protein n=1 Tax=Streptomyces sp. NPDC101194 TaxID=3366127 RepID=UPI00382500CB